MQPNPKQVQLQPVQIDPLMFNDIWDADLDLGIKVHDYTWMSKLYFDRINQDWLKHLTKLFVKYMAGNRSYATLRMYLDSISLFSRFLSERYSLFEVEDINRSIITEYLSFLNQKKLSASRKYHHIADLNTFFRTGIMNGWFEVPLYLIVPEDYPKQIKTHPRYIPEEVMQQLNQHLDALPEPVIRMVLILQECGLRIGELLQLEINCLKRDTKGDCFLQFMQWKMNQELTIPISTEVATVIQEQQQFIQANLGNDFQYLFCAREKTGRNHEREFKPVPKVMGTQTFARFLKKISEKFDIKDNLGKPWNFQSHQFRHTVGTRMVNSGVPLHIIQRYLGHESPTMTQRYAHIHDETLKKEIAEFHGKVVNVFGQIVSAENPELDNDADLQWMRKNILTQSLPNGSCARPIVKGPCPHANACLTCGDFRTTREFLDEHKIQLEQTEKIIEKAKANGWQRQVEMNEQVKVNLQNIIKSLDNETS